ncbi:hypothetical protein CK203_026884 [Vitis vinifera]|uniref:Retrovirus-related Pol polyprotein from transposon TNT 1-94 n=1 Tax=Vitis vinifera TaxID=29760 RepID=A0A438INT3_VITVI|nr:hypothetical protein CK203_026884 [Vitis vinifera]
MQVQESRPTTSYEVNDPSSPKISLDFVDISDLNMLIATSSKALNSKEWKQAMRAEMEALEKNGTWDVDAKRKESSRVQVGVHNIEIGKTRYKPVDTPIDPNHKLGEASEDAP